MRSLGQGWGMWPLAIKRHTELDYLADKHTPSCPLCVTKVLSLPNQDLLPSLHSAFSLCLLVPWNKESEVDWQQFSIYVLDRKLSHLRTKIFNWKSPQLQGLKVKFLQVGLAVYYSFFKALVNLNNHYQFCFSYSCQCLMISPTPNVPYQRMLPRAPVYSPNSLLCARDNCFTYDQLFASWVASDPTSNLHL